MSERGNVGPWRADRVEARRYAPETVRLYSSQPNRPFSAPLGQTRPFACYLITVRCITESATQTRGVDKLGHCFLWVFREPSAPFRQAMRECVPESCERPDD
jgi:hypothetical protein